MGGFMFGFAVGSSLAARACTHGPRMANIHPVAIKLRNALTLILISFSTLSGTLT